MERGCSELEGTLTSQLQQVVNYLRAMEILCVHCQVRQAGSCRQCQLGCCTLCQQEKGECDVCSVPTALTTNPGAGGAKSCAQRLQAKGMKGAEVVSVNMHRLGESFVEKVSDVLLQLTDIGLRVALTGAAGADIFFIPEIHFTRETPELDDEGWWYQVRTSYGAESVKNAEFARSRRGSSEMNGTKSNLPYALGVSLEKMRNGLPQA
jgi:hypothetical protein